MRKLAAFVIFIWATTALLLWLFLPSLEARGQFGDLFGAVNALFSGLAFAGLYSALKLQQSQLELQRNELTLQREELRMQREEMIASRAELASQVRAQHALVKASTAQIAVAGFQAQIEAIKMDSEQRVPGARGDYVLKIEAISKAMTALADKLEQQTQDSQPSQECA